MTGQDNEAFDAFYKATWSYENQSSGYYWLACLSCRKGDYQAALEFIEQSMIRNWHNMKARTLKAAILRALIRTRSCCFPNLPTSILWIWVSATRRPLPQEIWQAGNRL